MEVFEQLEVLYMRIENDLRISLFDAMRLADQQKANIIDTQRRLNDQAYFLFCFTRLEGIIKDIVTPYFQSSLDETYPQSHRKAWELLKDKRNRLTFMEKVSFLFPREHENYRRIEELYQIRNSLAHGQSYEIVDFLSHIREFKLLTDEANRTEAEL